MEATRVRSEAGAGAPFAWRDEFLVGVPEVDAQHRRRLDMIGAFSEARAEKRPAEQALGELLNGLVECTATTSRPRSG